MVTVPTPPPPVRAPPAPTTAPPPLGRAKKEPTGSVLLNDVSMPRVVHELEAAATARARIVVLDDLDARDSRGFGAAQFTGPEATIFGAATPDEARAMRAALRMFYMRRHQDAVRKLGEIGIIIQSLVPML